MGSAEAVKLVTDDQGRALPGEADISGAVAQGDHHAAIGLCARHYGSLIGRLCMSLVGSQTEAEELTRDTLVEAFGHLGGLAEQRGAGSVRAWLLSIARCKCARQLERRGRRSSALRLVDPAASASGAAQQDLQQRAERARGGLADVRPSEREAVVMRYGAQLSLAEVAQAFEIDEHTARRRVSRGVAALRERLQKEGQER